MMRVLGIETSCDETAAALLDGDPANGRAAVVAERIASQIEVHARYGGIVPEIASREHLAALPPMVDALLTESGCGWTEIDAIAVTAGPGLMGALLVGVGYARAAGHVRGIPVRPVHHMEAHLLAAGITGELPPFPFVCLLVSGGHTLLVRVDGVGRYRVIGRTVDDAAGECFDKTARLLGLPYPGGPAIAALAKGGDPARFPLPRPMLRRDNLDFSFSGLKTAVMHAARGVGEGEESARRDLAAAVEEAIADVLVGKAVRACERERCPRLIVAGGVAANRRLRARLDDAAAASNVAVHLPDPRYCTDNGAMVAYAGFRHVALKRRAPKEWDAAPRWPLEREPQGDAD